MNQRERENAALLICSLPLFQWSGLKPSLLVLTEGEICETARSAAQLAEDRPLQIPGRSVARSSCYCASSASVSHSGPWKSFSKLAPTWLIPGWFNSVFDVPKPNVGICWLLWVCRHFRDYFLMLFYHTRCIHFIFWDVKRFLLNVWSMRTHTYHFRCDKVIMFEVLGWECHGFESSKLG